MRARTVASPEGASIFVRSGGSGPVVVLHPSVVTTARISPACVFLSYPPAGRDERPIPRRSGTTMV